MVRIITDSASDFENHELESLGITCIPLSVIFGDEEYKEGINITKDEFYKYLTEKEDHPKTSQPTTADFLDMFEKFKEAGDEVVGRFISSKLSGTFQGAQLAKSMCEYENCYLIDSLSATAGERLLAIEAVRLRDMGLSAKEIFEKIDSLKENLKIYACLDTLEYLRRGGRVSDSVAKIGTVAHIKPIIHLCNNGVVEIPAKAIGRRKGISYIVKQFTEVSYNADYPFYVLYSHEKENAILLKDALEKEGITVPEECIVNIGAVIGAHVGPGAFGIAYIQ